MRNQGFNTSRMPSRRSRGGYVTSTSRPYERKEPSLDQLMKGLGIEIETIPVPSAAGQSSPVSIKSLEALASYSWLEAATPTIIVPGSPPVWRGRTMPYTVPRDTGLVFIDQNAARLSSSPLLPLIAAVSHHAPGFSLASVDFVTDRNGLRKLSRWASGDPKSGTFRIDIDLVGHKTVLMQRWETETTQVGGPGYEQAFEKASTNRTVGCEDAIGHHRIITYDLGGLKMLVRFKCDACLSKESTNESESQTVEVEHDPLDELTTGLQKLTVAMSSNAATKVPALKGASLSLLTRGTLVPQSDLLELKTRSIRSVHEFDWEDTYSQLLLSQTPNIFLCVHQRGEFVEVKKRKLAELETEAVARKTQENLRKLRKVLGMVQDTMTAEGEGAKFSLVCKPGADMVLYEREGKETRLPDEALKKFTK
ncbi:hypothetical protein JB92DRAFT_2985577 [Gautieria morchelliformis]|nr:hypothetical protein JB92DRAFT_2985577 [Gautieria morchelliformis]